MKNLLENLSGKNVNFLIGAGASSGMFDTLKLSKNVTFEDLVTDNSISEKHKNMLYYFYWIHWIKKMSDKESYKNETAQGVLDKYHKFIELLISFLKNESNERPKRINIYTSNYDLFFEHTFDNILAEGADCYFNDGAVGFNTRVIKPENYNLNIRRVGYFDRYKTEIPTINFIKVHGSVNWEKNNKDEVIVNSSSQHNIYEVFKEDEIKEFENNILNIKTDVKEDYINQLINELNKYNDKQSEFDKFYKSYKKLAIINPNKWKFHETVFEQHYYQQLRNLSYDLEKENTILIVFGFSFADEHIREIVRRSLSNQTLYVYLICYDKEEKEKISKYFINPKNIEYLPNNNKSDDGKEINGNFEYLNKLLGDKNG